MMDSGWQKRPARGRLRAPRREAVTRALSDGSSSAQGPCSDARPPRAMHRRSHVSPLIEARARQHRAALTSTEELLWSHIRGGRLGVWFRRQVPLGRFIVDFHAPRARLVIQVDGGYHVTRRSADQRRDRTLCRMGYRMVRLDAELVRRDAHAAIALIRAALA